MLFANDGCRTGSAVVYPTPIPIGSFTTQPICLGKMSYPLTSIIPIGTPTTGGFAGPNVTVTTGAFFINLSPANPNFSTIVQGVYNYTYTYGYPSPGPNAGCIKTYTFNVQYLPTPTIVTTPPCIYSGQSSTLTSQPPAISYTWMPGSLNSSSIIVSPTVSTTYVLQYSFATCSGHSPPATVHFLVPVTFTNLPTSTLCTFQNINYLENFLSNGVPQTGTWTASGGMGIATSTLGTSAVLSPSLNAGVYTISYVYSPGTATCTSGNHFTINIAPGFSLVPSGPSIHCANLSFISTISATSTTGGLTYSWMPGSLIGPTHTVNPTSSLIYTVTASSPVCSLNSTLAMNVSTQCCQAPNYITSPTLGTSTLGPIFAINSDVIITGSVTLNGEFRFAPNVKITVAAGGYLASGKTGAHLYACNDMWSGIVVENGGRVKLYPSGQPRVDFSEKTS